MATTVSAEVGPMLLERVEWPGIATLWKHQTLSLASTPKDEGLEHAGLRHNGRQRFVLSYLKQHAPQV